MLDFNSVPPVANATGGDLNQQRDAIRADLRSIRKTTTAAGNIRFEADRGPGGHADRFWALALALHAASGKAVEYAYHPVSRREHADLGRDIRVTAGFGRGAGLW